jgi:decaprenylphospho-beta-D-ribofuranose 2-oxidase
MFEPGGKKRLANWGNYPALDATVVEFKNSEAIVPLLSEHASFVTRGSGLSYGDASLANTVVSTLRYNKILNFNTVTGTIQVEAGITLDEVLQKIVPMGWFLPVTPGTKFITVGGAVAGDVHGKNHHSEGAFCKYVVQIEVMMADGRREVCGPDHNPELFRLICGGLGHAAIILSVTFNLKSIKTAFIRQRNVVVNNLEAMLENLQSFNAATYSVSWIDCLARGSSLGRGVIMLGEHAATDEVTGKDYLQVHRAPKLSAPFFFPAFLLNSFSVRTFNFLYFHKFRLSAKESIVHYDPYFYPLDFVRNWNKLYGRRGFLQYQFVIPFDQASKGLRIILDKISKSGMASFLAVLKALGEGENLLSFPMPGFTLALDFPVSDKIFALLDELDKIVVDLGGRIYLVKDARMQPEIYWKGYPNATKFKTQVSQLDPRHQFESALSKRLNML